MLVLGQAALGLGLGVLVLVAARVAHGDARLLGHLLDLGDVLLALVARERRHREADDLAVRLRIDAEVGLLDRLDELGQRRGIEGLDHDLARLGDRDRGHLRDRRGRAVVLDANVLDQRARGARGADRAHQVLQVVQGLLHLVARVLDDRLVAHAQLRMRVPRVSPRTTRSRLPSSKRLKTITGRRFSMQSVIAVPSMTERPCCRTSMYESSS